MFSDLIAGCCTLLDGGGSFYSARWTRPPMQITAQSFGNIITRWTSTLSRPQSDYRWRTHSRVSTPMSPPSEGGVHFHQIGMDPIPAACLPLIRSNQDLTCISGSTLRLGFVPLSRTAKRHALHVELLKLTLLLLGYHNGTSFSTGPR
jgi:hypothetical protein